MNAMRALGSQSGLPVVRGPRMRLKWAPAGEILLTRYSFYGDGNESMSGALGNMPYKNVGKVLYVNDYE